MSGADNAGGWPFLRPLPGAARREDAMGRTQAAMRRRSERPLIKIVSSANQSGRPGLASDDRVGCLPELGCAWVIDGATDLVDEPVIKDAASDAGWYADELSAAFVAAGAPADPSVMFEQVIERARERLYTYLGGPPDHLPAWSMPSAAALWCRWEPDLRRLTFAGLGDCVGLALTSGGRLLRAHGTMHKDTEITNAQTWLETLSREEIRERLRAVRARMNTPQGYWIFSIHPEAAERAPVERLRLAPGETATVLLMSDGLHRLVTPYARFTEGELVHFCAEHGVDAAIRELRSLEQDPEDDQRFGRLKRSDDAAAICFEIA